MDVLGCCSVRAGRGILSDALHGAVLHEPGTAAGAT